MGTFVGVAQAAFGQGQTHLDGLAPQLHLPVQRCRLAAAAQHQVQRQQAAQIVHLGRKVVQLACRRQRRLLQPGQLPLLPHGLLPGQRAAQPHHQQQQRGQGTRQAPAPGS